MGTFFGRWRSCPFLRNLFDFGMQIARSASTTDVHFHKEDRMAWRMLQLQFKNMQTRPLALNQ